MKTKITPKSSRVIISKINFFGFLFILFVYTLNAQDYIIVENVFPIRVSNKTEVKIIGQTGSRFSTSTNIVCNGIYSSGTKTVNGDQISFTITKSSLYVSNPPHNDVGKTDLLIDGKLVYIGHYEEGEQVRLEYVAPREKDYTSSSDFAVTEVFTDWDKDGNSFWRSGSDGTGGKPNDKHNLLAFKYNNKIYSTGVKDMLLENNDIIFEPQVFNAYSSTGISGKADSQNYLAMADLIDGRENQVELNHKVRATVYDVIIEGKNGLGMGTGITNFNQNASIRFFSAIGNPAGVIDDKPDLLITQIAQPGSPDTYYYANERGDVIGRPIYLKITGNSPKLFKWKLDLYSMNLVDYDGSYPSGPGFSAGQERDFRMVAFKLSDFEIAENNLSQVKNINMMAGGTADIAFIAYNKATFAIKSPRIDEFPVSRSICDLTGNIEVTFHTKASINGIDTGEDKEKLEYQWYRNYIPITGADSNSYSLPLNISEADLITYRVRVKNWYGAIDLPVTLSEGGIISYWNGPTEGWVFPANYYNGSLRRKSDLKFEISDSDRKLMFNEDYNENESLKGCDCIIGAGKKVTIKSGKNLTLYSFIDVRSAVPSSGGSLSIPAGTLTLENNASLVQTKDVDVNVNSGDILVKRDAVTENKYDYVYWSSPVEEGNLSMIPGTTSHVYEWSTKAENGTSLKGNWVNPTSDIMENGRGYIKRFNTPDTYYSQFTGVPNNGTIPIKVYKTDPLPSGPVSTNAHLNLLGNPYPSAISAETFLIENENLDGWVQVWTHSQYVKETGADDPFYGDFKYNYGDQYLTYNLTGITPPNNEKFDGYIASGQGFFVRVKNNASEESIVNFKNNMRYGSTAPNGYDNTGFFRSSSETKSDKEIKQLIWLSLVNEQLLSSTTLVGYVDGATFGKDRLYDVVSGSGEMKLFSVIEEADLLIQGRPAPFDDNDEVALGVEILKNGIYKIAINKLKGELMENENQKFFLEDRYTNTIHNLKTAPYGFTATAGNYKDRFVLRYTDRELSVEDQTMSNTFVYVKNSQLFIKASNSIEAVTVYDLTGKLLTDYKLDGHSDNFNSNFPFSNGAYLVSLKMDNGQTITKKVIN